MNDLMLITEASSHSAQGLFDPFDAWTFCSQWEKLICDIRKKHPRQANFQHTGSRRRCPNIFADPCPQRPKKKEEGAKRKFKLWKSSPLRPKLWQRQEAYGVSSCWKGPTVSSLETEEAHRQIARHSSFTKGAWKKSTISTSMKVQQ